jgi:hypothetical protein
VIAGDIKMKTSPLIYMYGDLGEELWLEKDDCMCFNGSTGNDDML